MGLHAPGYTQPRSLQAWTTRAIAITYAASRMYSLRFLAMSLTTTHAGEEWPRPPATSGDPVPWVAWDSWGRPIMELETPVAGATWTMAGGVCPAGTFRLPNNSA